MHTKTTFAIVPALIFSLLVLCSTSLAWDGAYDYSYDAEGRLTKVNYNYQGYQYFSYAPNGSLKNEYLTDSGDTDTDGLPDSWELDKFLDLSHRGYYDDDSDGLTNEQEYLNGTEPLNDDTDGDGAKDGAEIAADTDPLNQDSDSDGMFDGWELDHNLNALADDSAEDPDGDGWTNLQEYKAGTDPRNGESHPNAVLAPIFSILLKSE